MDGQLTHKKNMPHRYLRNQEVAKWHIQTLIGTATALQLTVQHLSRIMFWSPYGFSRDPRSPLSTLKT